MPALRRSASSPSVTVRAFPYPTPSSTSSPYSSSSSPMSSASSTSMSTSGPGRPRRGTDAQPRRRVLADISWWIVHRGQLDVLDESPSYSDEVAWPALSLGSAGDDTRSAAGFGLGLLPGVQLNESISEAEGVGRAESPEPFDFTLFNPSLSPSLSSSSSTQSSPGRPSSGLETETEDDFTFPSSLPLPSPTTGAFTYSLSRSGMGIGGGRGRRQASFSSSFSNPTTTLPPPPFPYYLVAAASSVCPDAILPPLSLFTAPEPSPRPPPPGLLSPLLPSLLTLLAGAQMAKRPEPELESLNCKKYFYLSNCQSALFTSSSTFVSSFAFIYPSSDVLPPKLPPFVLLLSSLFLSILSSLCLSLRVYDTSLPPFAFKFFCTY
ncbi:hypothetical protein SISSUDRAFT_1064796 [Sistotremastrum suecicum HHB10207 ss-3]|uniref:Uncharacterized protein n=1 Tax=Sistotremastrum suecicum HHB10207 ss-3 TaxID=1314776 RepID=A0A166A8D4_9AGAM|nr:hypothetical protein SISSUDRAFT_1064796 [Sistotremastrum suecicum HHB10207 ss-3]